MDFASSEFPSNNPTTQSLKRKIENYNSDLRKKNLNMIFIKKRNMTSSAIQNLNSQGLKNFEDLEDQLVFWLCKVESIFETLSPSNADGLADLLTKMQSFVSGLISVNLENLFEKLLNQGKLHILREIVKLNYKEYPKVIEAVFMFFINVFTVSNEVLLRFCDSALLETLLSYVETENHRIAGMALLCLGNLVTGNNEVRNELELKKAEKLLFDLFKMDFGSLSEDSSAEHIELVESYFYFFGGFFNLRPFLPAERTQFYLEPFFAAICEFDSFFASSLPYIVDFFNAVCQNLDEEIFMRHLDTFGPVFGQKLVKMLKTGDGELQGIVSKLIANIGAFQDDRVYKVFEGTELIEVTKSLINCGNEEVEINVLQYINNFLFAVDQPTSREILGDTVLYDLIGDKLLNGYFSELYLLYSLNSYLKNWANGFFEIFKFVKCDIFGEIRMRMTNAKSSEELMVLLQMINSFFGISAFFVENQDWGEDVFYNFACGDVEFINNREMINECHVDEKVRSSVEILLKVFFEKQN